MAFLAQDMNNSVLAALASHGQRDRLLSSAARVWLQPSDQRQIEPM
jgi:hypothetical protein